MASSTCKNLFLGIFEYYTPKIVLIKNIKVGVFNRLLQLAIVGYIIGYAIVWNKGYQDFSTIESSVTTKVKGVAYTNFSDDEFDERIKDKNLYRRIWDTSDFVVPPSENGAFFVMTNVVITSNQKQGVCDEDPEVFGAKCEVDSDCVPDLPLLTGNGVLTGKCIISEIDNKTHVCEIHGWCPVERDVNPLVNKTALLAASKNFTVLIKNFVDFPKFKIKRRNIPEFSNETYLKSCNYNSLSDPLCPIFVLEDIVPADYDKIALKGGVVAIIIDWECNFDFKSSNCFPTYTFRRLDDEFSKLSPGLNFRFAQYYSDSSRTLYKAYGIKFIILTQGRGGKFSVVPLLLNVGSGLGLLVVATILCDVVVLYCAKNREVYKSGKYQSVDDETSGTSLSEAIRRHQSE